MSLAGLRPWRCQVCENRFYGWAAPVSMIFYAHCSQCGNFDLQRISRDRVEHGALLGLKRTLRFRAYRCAPCRRRFFCVRPRTVLVPRDMRASSEAEAGQRTEDS